MSLYCDPKCCTRTKDYTDTPAIISTVSFLGTQVNKNVANVSSSIFWINLTCIRNSSCDPSLSYLVFFQTIIILKLDLDDNCFWIKTYTKRILPRLFLSYFLTQYTNSAVMFAFKVYFKGCRCGLARPIQYRSVVSTLWFSSSLFHFFELITFICSSSNIRAQNSTTIKSILEIGILCLCSFLSLW